MGFPQVSSPIRCSGSRLPGGALVARTIMSDLHHLNEKNSFYFSVIRGYITYQTVERWINEVWGAKPNDVPSVGRCEPAVADHELSIVGDGGGMAHHQVSRWCQERPWPSRGGTHMKTRFIALALSLLLITPVIVGAAGSGRVELPAAVDQLLAADMIQVAQQNLKSAGFDPGHVDGIFDAQTEAAILAYQGNYGLPRTGMLDETTRNRLLPGLSGEEG
ncbi:MAG: peptidoglycan-binding protein [Nitrospinae bacterium]|nr:peptidoglycan-binding protein [Nitrospinota bacterium]